MAKRNKLINDRIKELEKFVNVKKGSAKGFAKAQAVLLYEMGTSIELITAITGLKRSAIFKWRARFIKYGIDAFKDKEGAKPRQRLTRGQIQEIYRILTTKSPKDFGYEARFWTTAILAHLIKEQYGVGYKTKKPLYLLFKESKFTYHKPSQKYRNRDQEKINQWIKDNKPDIEAYMRDPEVVVLTGDEMVLSTQTTFQKIWLPINSFPKIDVSNKRANRSIYGFLNVKNGVEHAFKTEWQNSVITIKVLDLLCKEYPGKKIVLIWDNAPWHRGKEVRKWLKDTKHNIHLIAFPPYAPELNPQEHVWKEGRAQVTHNKFIENIEKTAVEFVNYLNDRLFKYSLLNIVHA